MEAIILLAFIGVLGMMSPRRWRHRVIAPVAIVVLILSLVVSPFGVQLATWGLVSFLPTDSGETADSIVVLGRGWEFRYQRVAEVQKQWNAKRASKIFASGMLDASEIVEQLTDRGIPRRVLSGERCSQSTEENAMFTSTLLSPQQYRKILLITDQPHMLRAFLTFLSFGFSVIPHPISMPPQWSPQQQIFVIAREYTALAQYALTGRFKPRSAELLKQPKSEASSKIVAWNCYVQ